VLSSTPGNAESGDTHPVQGFIAIGGNCCTTVGCHKNVEKPLNRCKDFGGLVTSDSQPKLIAAEVGTEIEVTTRAQKPSDFATIVFHGNGSNH
jgi:hypothetical protein